MSTDSDFADGAWFRDALRRQRDAAPSAEPEVFVLSDSEMNEFLAGRPADAGWTVRSDRADSLGFEPGTGLHVIEKTERARIKNLRRFGGWARAEARRRERLLRRRLVAGRARRPRARGSVRVGPRRRQARRSSRCRSPAGAEPGEGEGDGEGEPPPAPPQDDLAALGAGQQLCLCTLCGLVALPIDADQLDGAGLTICERCMGLRPR